MCVCVCVCVRASVSGSAHAWECDTGLTDVAVGREKGANLCAGLNVYASTVNESCPIKSSEQCLCILDDFFLH